MASFGTRFADLRIGTKLLLLITVFLAGFSLFALFSITSLNRVKINGPIYNHIVQNHQLVQDILPPPLYIIESHMNALQLLEAAQEEADPATLARLVRRGEELRRDYEEHYAAWMRTLPEGELKQALARSHDPALQFYRVRDEKYVRAVLAGFLEHAAAIHHGVLQPAFDAHRVWVEQAVAVASRHAMQDEKQAASTITATVVWLMAIAFVTAAGTILFSLMTSRSITVPLTRISAVANEIAGGKVDVAQVAGFSYRNEIGALVRAFNTMTAQLSAYIAKLGASETKYRIVADNTYDWEFWRSPDGEYVYSSPSCERITGHPPADFAADASLVLRMIHPEDRDAFECHQHEMLSGGSCPTSELEFRITAADGTLHWISHICCPVYDESGAFLGKRGTNRDITQRKSAEMQLVEAKELAEAANRAKSAFITAMSHELRTPLNTIIGYTEVMLGEEPGGTQRKHLEAMRTSGQYLLTLINEVLEIGSMESEAAEVRKTSFDLPSMLGQVAGIARGMARQKGLRFGYLPDASLPQYVEGDEGKLQQILLRLLENAIRFTPRGSVTVGAVYDYESGVLLCEVIDTGIGIAAEKLDAIFDPFTQLAREGQVTDGTGLGLTITRHLLTAMGGSIEVASEPAKGSTFRVKVPLVAMKQGGAAPAAPPAPPVAAAARGERYAEDEVPPLERLRELSELALLGDMKRIGLWAVKVREEGDRWRRFADEVSGLADGFKAKAIAALVEQYLPKKNEP